MIFRNPPLRCHLDQYFCHKSHISNVKYIVYQCLVCMEFLFPVSLLAVSEYENLMKQYTDAVKLKDESLNKLKKASFLYTLIVYSISLSVFWKSY